MQTCSFLFSRVGHTHSRLDALYGLLSVAFRHLSCLLDMNDVKQLLA